MTCCHIEKTIRYDEAILFNQYITSSLLVNELAFYKDTIQFNKFIGTKKEIIKSAQRIFDQYLKEDADNEIYVSQRILTDIKQKLRKKKLINSFIYQEAMIEISNLLESGWKSYKSNFETKAKSNASMCLI